MKLIKKRSPIISQTSVNLFAQLLLMLSFLCSNAYAESGHSAVEEEIEKGPNNGRMLKQDNFAIELSIFERGIPPEFRVYATLDNKELPANAVDVKVKLTRLGNVIDDINFTPENNYLRGDMEIYEPHSFAVSLTAKYANKTYQWSYDNFEGRTLIGHQMADAMNILTETVTSQTLEQTLKVYGQLKLPPSAVRHISARFPGEVKSLKVLLGQTVKKGQLLMLIESNESLQTYQVFSPINGIVTQQNINTGEQTGNRSLMTISNTAQLIAELNVFPLDQHKVKLNSAVKILLPEKKQDVQSHLFDSLIKLNPDQAKIFRANIDNSNGDLNVGQFVSAEISLDTFQVPLAVKKTALQSFRDFTVVYAKVGEEYEVRMLELGRETATWVEVLSGIPAGTEYVVNNSYLIKADIEKSGASHDH